MKASPSDNFPFADFLSLLRAHGFNITVDHHVRIYRLASTSGGTLPPDRLAGILCPLVATSQQEQVVFHDLFNCYFSSLRGKSEEPSYKRPRIRKKRGHWLRRAQIAGAVIILIACVNSLLPRPRKQEGFIAAVRPSRHAVAAVKSPGLAKGNEPEASTQGSPQPELALFTQKAESPWAQVRSLLHDRWNAIASSSPSPWLLEGGACLCVFYLGSELFRRLTRRALGASVGPAPGHITTLTLPAYADPVSVKNGAAFRALARELQRRENSEALQFHAGDSIQATIAAGGCAQYRYRHVNQPPEYLALIDRSSYRDHQAAFFERRIDALRKENVLISHFFFDRDPRVCTDASGRTYFLGDLLRRHPDHRLLLLSEGEILLDPIEVRLAEGCRELLGWERRVLLTPSRAKRWERALAKEMLVFHATLGGWHSAAACFNGDVLKQSETSTPIPPFDLGTALDSVREAIGERAFQWFCACAVFPELHWSMTMGLRSALGIDPCELSEEIYLYIFNHPWFRKGYMPVAVRSAMVQALGHKRNACARLFLTGLIESSADPESMHRLSDEVRIGSESGYEKNEVLEAEEGHFTRVQRGGGQLVLKLPESLALRFMKARTVRAISVRAIIASTALCLIFFGFVARLVQLQVFEHTKWAEIAWQKQFTKVALIAHRGLITDIHGEILADNVALRTVVADGTLIANSQKVAEVLAEPLKMSAEEIQAKIDAPRRHVVLKSGISSVDADQIKKLIDEKQIKGLTFEAESGEGKGQNLIADQALLGDSYEAASVLAARLGMNASDLSHRMAWRLSPYIVLKKNVPESVTAEISKRLNLQRLRGVFFEQDSRRIYLNGRVLSHVLGFTTRDNGGSEGVEATMEQYLRGYDGFRYAQHDAIGKEVLPPLRAHRTPERAARDGCTVRLTVDMGLQNIVEAELDSAFKQYQPEMATVIMMEPQTGRILAMANRPNFDPNDLNACKPEEMRSCAVINMVEPGSLFKIVTASGALDAGLVTPDTIIPCESGHFDYAGRVLHDFGSGNHPDLSWTDVLVKSSNIGAAKLAMKLGEQRFYEYIRSFGFGERTGINLPGEIAGLVNPPEKWSKIAITRIPLGQGVGVTPIQMVAAMSAIANGGKLIKPQIVDAVVDSAGQPIASFVPVVVRQVVTPETTAKVRAALEGVVSRRGTAFLATVPGFRVGGKAGTVNKPDPHGSYYDDRYVTSFIGFLPVDDPKFVCLVMLDDPKVSEDQAYGGVTAAPAFSHIAEKAAQYLNLTPTN